MVSLASRIVTTWADRGPGLLPDARVAALTRQMEHLGATIAGEAIARVSRPAAPPAAGLATADRAPGAGLRPTP